jgi:chromosome segregation ATPase
MLYTLQESEMAELRMKSESLEIQLARANAAPALLLTENANLSQEVRSLMEAAARINQNETEATSVKMALSTDHDELTKRLQEQEQKYVELQSRYQTIEQRLETMAAASDTQASSENQNLQRIIQAFFQSITETAAFLSITVPQVPLEKVDQVFVSGSELLTAIQAQLSSMQATTRTREMEWFNISNEFSQQLGSLQSQNSAVRAELSAALQKIQFLESRVNDGDAANTRAQASSQKNYEHALLKYQAESQRELQASSYKINELQSASNTMKSNITR